MFLQSVRFRETDPLHIMYPRRCPGGGTDFDDPRPARIRVRPARPSTESRPVCYEPRRWRAMHSPLSPPNATIQVVSTLRLCVFTHAAL